MRRDGTTGQVGWPVIKKEDSEDGDE